MKTKGLLGTICAVTIAASLAGCSANKNYGTVIPDERYNTPQKIEEKADHTYFMAGNSKDSPRGIIGVDNSYKLGNETSWKSLDSQDKTFRDSVEDLNNQTSDMPESIHKYDLIGPEGKDVGDLYFKGIDSGITIKKREDGTFYISTPRISFDGGDGGTGGGSPGGGSSGGGNAGGGA